MRKIIAILILLAANAVLAVSSGPTPFFYSSRNSDGSANTNEVDIQAWPPVQNAFTTYGTNIIFGAYVQTNIPNSSGFFSNSIYAGTYRVLVPAFSLGFFVTMPDTTNYLSLATYATNAAIVSTGFNNFQLVTNWLNYWPATNSHPGIEAAWGGPIQPASTTLSNLVAGTTLGLTNNGVRYSWDALGQMYATNTASHAWLLVDTNMNIYLDGIAVLTNSAAFDPAGAANAATNSGKVMFTNTVIAPAQVPTYAGDVTNGTGGTTNLALAAIVAAGTSPKVTYDAKGRVVATNSLTYVDVTGGLGFNPGTNNVVPQVGVSLIASLLSVVTNGGTCWASYRTNGTPGPAGTNLPFGSIMTVTNSGYMYVLSNSAGLGVWMPK